VCNTYNDNNCYLVRLAVVSYFMHDHQFATQLHHSFVGYPTLFFCEVRVQFSLNRMTFFVHDSGIKFPLRLPKVLCFGGKQNGRPPSCRRHHDYRKGTYSRNRMNLFSRFYLYWILSLACCDDSMEVGSTTESYVALVA
jgi:hypothetical protein